MTLEPSGTQQTFGVDGLRCEGCVGTVTDALSSLDTVTAVAVELASDGTSTVRVSAATELTAEQVQAALSAKGNFSVVS